LEAQAVKVVALCGGIGGVKLALGLYHVLEKNSLTVICNTGDDINRFGLHVSPDVDIVMYTLAELVDSEKGWGLADESFTFLKTISELYRQEKWFTIGDRDLATHALRTGLLKQGMKLSNVTEKLCNLIGLDDVKLIPMSDDSVTTRIRTGDGNLIHFEEFFVKLRCEPEITEVLYDGADSATAASGVLESVQEADIVVICPSNPIASIGPILSIRQIRDELCEAACPVVGVSPLVGGKAVKGPTVKFMEALRLQADALGVAKLYQDFLSHFIIDEQDRELQRDIADLGVEPKVTNTIMNTIDDKKALARTVLSIAER
jgi:LPPG:FO 2-phospho-L-lactate transferase